MLADLGLASLFIAFLLSVYATAAGALAGARHREAWAESARNASLLTFPLLTLSVGALVYALYSLDFTLAYVADVSSQTMSPFLRVTALWGGQQGSLLFWAWLMASFVAAVLLRKWRRNRDLMPYFIATSMLTTTFFIGLVVFISNPFARLWLVPGADELTTAVFQPAQAMLYAAEDGQGLNPLLRHFGMIGHPPTTYLGFTGFVIPFSFAIAALLSGKARDEEWIRTSRSWTLVAWIFLTIGLVLGGRWAYDVLGWGGFWGWDPVENAMLMPWLTGTAFLHSVMITEKRGMLKVWSVALIILTYSLSLFGTFITRTGVIGSVHAFAKTALGPVFFAFIGLTFLGSLSLLLNNLKTLRAEHELESVLSRETAFLLQNTLFVGITFAVFWGTVFPMVSELVTGTKVTVGPPYFRAVTGPLFLALLVLMAIAPLMAWRKQSPRGLLRSLAAPLAASAVISAVWGFSHRMHPASFLALWMVSFGSSAIAFEFWKGIRARMQARGENPLKALATLLQRSHRRYGAMVIHLGVLMVAMGFVGDAYFKQETHATVSAGESVQLGGYELRFNGLRQYAGSDGRAILEASATLAQDGRLIRELRPRRDFFVAQDQPSTVPAVLSTPGEDVYVILVGWDEAAMSWATFKMYINPLINWAWAGGVIMVLGTLIAVWSFGEAEASYRLRPGLVASVVVTKE